MRLVLGSQSPRRQEILGFFTLPFDVATPDFDESSVAFEGDPARHATELALGKARSLAHRYPQQPVLTADTIVYQEGRLYGKPSGLDEAKDMLTALQGAWHSVFTALALSYKGKESFCCQETRVQFRSLSPGQMENYLINIAINDKAGAYAIQGAGGMITSQIIGCYYNVMGLPLEALTELLLPLGIDLWEYLR